MASTPEFLISRAGPGDAEEVREISAAAYLPAYEAVIGTAPRPAFEDYGPRIARGDVWLLQVENRSCGVIVLEPHADSLTVYSVAVLPEQQGRGYGRALLNFAEQRAQELGVQDLRLYTNARMTANLRLYESCGFDITGTRPHPSRPGERLVDMGKTLAPTDPAGKNN